MGGAKLAKVFDMTSLKDFDSVPAGFPAPVLAHAAPAAAKGGAL